MNDIVLNDKDVFLLDILNSYSVFKSLIKDSYV